MIIAVGSDKGSSGATTLAVLLGLVWPTERVVCELDPRGADLPYRMAGVDGQALVSSPSIATVAVDSRPGAGPVSLLTYTQPTAAGVPVITGEVSAARFTRLNAHLPAITTAFASWSGTVIADLGCLQPWNPGLLVARAATVVLLVSRADTANLGRLRDRVEELAADVGGPHRLRTPVAVVVRAERRADRQGARRVERLLASIGSPVPVLGTVADDSAAAAAVWSGTVTKRTLRSPLMTSAREIGDRIRGIWPELTDSSASLPATSDGVQAQAVPMGTVR